MKRNKVFLVCTPTDVAEKMSVSQKKIYNLGLGYLGAVLEQRGHEVKLFDFFCTPLRMVKEEFIKNFIEQKPDVVGFSIWTNNRVTSFKLIRILKKIRPDVKIITGGVHCSTLYEQILNNYPVDAVCIGEGESTINQLVENISNKGKLQDIKSIAFIKDGRVIKTADAPPIFDLDSLPFPKHESFLTPESKIAYISTSRGCVGRCIFCSAAAYWCSWRQRSAKNIIEEIMYIKNRFPNIEHIFFTDDAFTLDNKRVMDLCQKLIENKFKITWNCATRVHPISLEMLKYMQKAGCTSISLGIESGSEKILKSIKKNITKEQIIKAFELAKQAKLEVYAFMIVGLPSESDETINETIELLKKIDHAVPAASILELYPNTEIYEIAKQNGFIDDSYWLTDKKIPLYTYELPIQKLRSMVFKLVYQSFKNKGINHLIWFTVKRTIRYPKLTMQNIKTIVFNNYFKIPFKNKKLSRYQEKT